jgi:hypothetical protein
MRAIFICLLILVTSLPAFAQRRPIPRPRPIPNPYPSSCQVVAIDRYQRVIARFYARTDWQSGQCRDGLRQCNYEIRRRGWWDARCAQVRNPW